MQFCCTIQSLLLVCFTDNSIKTFGMACMFYTQVPPTFWNGLQVLPSSTSKPLERLAGVTFKYFQPIGTTCRRYLQVLPSHWNDLQALPSSNSKPLERLVGVPYKPVRVFFVGLQFLFFIINSIISYLFTIKIIDYYG
jgi:hypothetical protein